VYQVQVRIVGTAPLLQHKFPLDVLSGLMEGATRKTGSQDRRYEWLETLYASNGYLVQPATHVEGALVRAAAGFRVKGSRGKTYRDIIRAYVLVSPEDIPHLWNGQPITTPGPELLTTPTEALCVNLQRVIVNRAAVARARLQVNAGYELAFTITVNDDQIRPEVVKTILDEAGRAVGIGDGRPKFGRFRIAAFHVSGDTIGDGA
jgi:hypothetical protein